MSNAFSEIKSAIDQQLEVFDAFKQTHDKKLTAVQAENQKLLERIEELESRGTGPGRSISTTQKTVEVKAFENFVRTGNKVELEEIQRKEMSITGGAAAGQAFVPEIIASEIVSRAIARSRLASIVKQTGPVSSDYVRLLNKRGATASWSSETGSRSATATPELREIRPTHGELYAYPSFTRWLAEDSKFSVSEFVQENVSDVFAKSIESAILLGSGTNQPTGILNTNPSTAPDDASPERGADTIQVISGTADLSDDLIALYFSLKPEYRAKGSWLINSSNLAIVRKLRDPNGSGFLWQANLGASVDASDGLLLGRPVIISEYLSDPLAASPVAGEPVLFGDFNQGYELVRIGNMVLVRDDVTTPGKIKLYVAQRFGGRLVDNNAIKALRA